MVWRMFFTSRVPPIYYNSISNSIQSIARFTQGNNHRGLQVCAAVAFSICSIFMQVSTLARVGLGEGERSSSSSSSRAI